jgi:hypothetical protein
MKGRCSRRKITPWVLGVLVASCSLAAPSVRAGELSKAWVAAYEELHPGEVPPWRSQKEARTWALTERKRLEPFVLLILRGEEEGLPWTSGLPIARAIPTPEIRAVLFDRLQETVAMHRGAPVESSSFEALELSNTIEILSRNRHEGCRPLISELVTQDDQGDVIVEHCLRALQRVGNEETLEVLARVAAKHDSTHIKRLCAQTEAIIKARLAGLTPMPDVQRKLHALAEAYVLAIETRDYPGYMKTLMSGFEDTLDEDDVTREVFDDAQVAKAVASLKEALDGEPAFDVLRDELQAHLEIHDKYRLDCVLEADGWRIARLARIGP